MLKLIGMCAVTWTMWAAAGVGSAPQARQDDTLKDRIEYQLEVNKTTRKYNIDVAVDNGIVTLTGDVATQAQKAEAERVAKIDGVATVRNMIDVDPDVDKTLAERAKAGLSKMGEKITDAWITTKVHWFLAGDDLLEGSDIDVDTADHVVTLKGTVKTKAGQVRAVALTRDVDGVHQVVDHLTIGVR